MKTYGKPLLLWLAAVVGLLVALLEDGIAEALATAVCALPLIVIGLCVRSGLRANSTEKVKS